MPPAKSSSSSQRGFSLVEVVFSIALLTVVSLGVAQLFAASTNANRVARSRTSTTAMAEQKMEQIRSLSWGFDLLGQGLPVTDTTTNLAVYPHRDDGAGLNPSPSDTLLRNTPGYVDYLDANGAWIGTGDTPTAGAVYIRRWAIVPLPTNPEQHAGSPGPGHDRGRRGPDRRGRSARDGRGSPATRCSSASRRGRPNEPASASLVRARLLAAGTAGRRPPS